MKKCIILIVICQFMFSLSCFSQTEISMPEEFTAKTWNKLNLNLQNAWINAKKSGTMSDKIKCFVIVRSPPDSGDKSFLQSNGFNVLGATQFTAVSTGLVSYEDLPRVARLDFVRRINLVVKQYK